MYLVYLSVQTSTTHPNVTPEPFGGLSSAAGEGRGRRDSEGGEALAALNTPGSCVLACPVLFHAAQYCTDFATYWLDNGMIPGVQAAVAAGDIPLDQRTHR